MFAILSVALGAGQAPIVTAEALRAHYGDVRSFSADILQVKEGRFWARPFESKIRLHYTRERVVWETLSPIRSTVVIEGGRLAVSDSSGRERDVRAVAGDPRSASLLRFIRALIALDLAGLERDFVLSYGPGELRAKPRPGSALALFTTIRLQFGPELEITSLELETRNERTRLVFERIERESEK
jgi:hypothetical protein